MGSNGGQRSYEAFPMNPGDAEYSYAQNSTFQAQAIDLAKNMIKEAIHDKLDVETLLSHSSNAFNIAHLGCSTGPNTFFAVQNIIDSIDLKLQSHGYDSGKLEYHVFFNDHVGNDFNTLFRSLPVTRPYYAAGVPGSFHRRLFPNSTLHFVLSSYAIQWLSRVPIEIVDKHSNAYNKGKICSATASKEVVAAYLAQFAKDTENFLNSRALELVPGGLMAFLTPCPPKSLNKISGLHVLLGDTLVEMAKKGIVSEDLVDSFNLPIYFPELEELKALIEMNGNFSIEKMEPIIRPKTPRNVNETILQFRAVVEGLIRDHFGDELVNEIFEHCIKKGVESSIFTGLSYKEVIEYFVLIKRKSV